MTNKRGAISMEIIIVIILALITLVVVAAAFTGGMDQLMKKIAGIGSTIPGEEFASKTCESLCKSNSSNFCTYEFSGDLKGKKCKELYSCPLENLAEMKPSCK
ncbi:MAG: hypothetical protein KKE23_02860 [Nanoarchaeota archaeon]|nr:hypothetical protein [Nanoarchaeota archaeon]